jgi:preprotein translocase subunit SecG
MVIGFVFGHFVLGFLLFLVSLFLILLVLVQRGRGGGLAGALGGMGGQSAFGTKAGDLFTRVTVIVAIIWFMLSIFVIRLFNPPPRVTTDAGPDSSATQEGDAPQDVPPIDAGTPDQPEAPTDMNELPEGVSPPESGAPSPGDSANPPGDASGDGVPAPSDDAAQPDAAPTNPSGAGGTPPQDSPDSGGS